MNKFEFKLPKLLTKWLVKPILYRNTIVMQKNDINNRLQAQLYRDIEQRKRLLKKRAFAHAQTILPVDNLTLEPPDYGLGVIPKLTAIDNTNNEALRIIDECNHAIIKLSVIQSLLNDENTQMILGLLNDNQYYTLSVEKIKGMLGAKQISIEEILYS